MQFRGSGIVGITARDDTASGRTATTCGKISIIKTHAIRSQRINMWSFDHGVPVTSEIILGHIIRNEKDNVWLFTNRYGMKKEEQEGEEG